MEAGGASGQQGKVERTLHTGNVPVPADHAGRAVGASTIHNVNYSIDMLTSFCPGDVAGGGSGGGVGAIPEWRRGPTPLDRPRYHSMGTEQCYNIFCIEIGPCCIAASYLCTACI